jgi:CDGSH iron-sulfur domain-containing protein 3
MSEGTDEGTTEVSITVGKAGPLTVRGPVTLVGADGEPWTDVPAGTNLALCRCGQSGKKPFCDGSHRAAGFDSAPTPADQPYPW